MSNVCSQQASTVILCRIIASLPSRFKQIYLYLWYTCTVVSERDRSSEWLDPYAREVGSHTLHRTDVAPLHPLCTGACLVVEGERGGGGSREGEGGRGRKEGGRGREREEGRREKVGVYIHWNLFVATEASHYTVFSPPVSRLLDYSTIVHIVSI